MHLPSLTNYILLPNTFRPLNHLQGHLFKNYKTLHKLYIIYVNNIYNASFEAIKVVIWVVTPCSVVKRYRRSWGTSCLRLRH